MWTWQLGPEVVVQAPADSLAATTLDTLFRPMRIDPAPPSTPHRLTLTTGPRPGSGTTVFVNHIPIAGAVSEGGLPPLVESLLTHYAASRTRSCGVLHAAGLVWNGCGFLFPAERASGKSTLCLHLNRLGADYMGDDLVFIEYDERRVHAFPKAITLKQGSFCLFPEVPTYSDPVRGPVRYVLPQPFDRLWYPFETIRCLVFPTYDQRGRTTLQAIRPEVAALGLVQQVFGGQERDERSLSLVSALACLPAYLMTYSNLDQAVDFLEGLRP